MDPTTAIITMLVKAAQPTAQRMIADAYQVLRTTLIRKYPNLGLAITEVETHPEWPPAREWLAQLLRSSGADRDTEIVALTDQLRHLVEELQPGTGAELVSAAKRRAGGTAMRALLDEHVNAIMRARQTYAVEDAQLLAGNVDQSSLPEPVRAELRALHQSMRGLILTIAERLQEDSYQDARSALRPDDIGRMAHQRAMELIEADRELHTSYQTLALTVEYFGEFNRELLARIEGESSAQRQGRMMLGNAVMIYELADFVIRYVREFAPWGIDRIDALWAESLARIEDRRHRERALEQEALALESAPETREDLLAAVRGRLEALAVLEDEWSSYVDETRQLSGMVDDVRSRVRTLELIRDNAAAQISTLQEIALLRFLKQNTQTINRTVDALHGFRLAPLTPSRVRRLVGAV